MKNLRLPAGVWAAIFAEIHRKQMNWAGRMKPVTVSFGGDTYQVAEARDLGNINILFTPGETGLQRVRNEIRRLQEEDSRLKTTANARIDKEAPNASSLTKSKDAAKARRKTIEVRLKELEQAEAGHSQPQKFTFSMKDLMDTRLWSMEGAAAEGDLDLDAIKDSVGKGIEEASDNLHQIFASTMGLAVTVDDIARSAHEANRAYCLSIGDESQLPWDEAPDWQKASAAAGVAAYVANPDLTPAETHAKWMEHKATEGWVYGETKDPEAKTHPCMVPYEELPAAQQAKDHIYRAVVTSLLPKLRATAEFIGKVKDATPGVTMAEGEAGAEAARTPATRGRNAKKEESKG